MKSKLAYTLVEDHSRDGLRSGEGSIVALKDGRLLFFYSRFLQAGGDGDPAHIAARTSTDGGLSWSEPWIQFAPPEGTLNAMSASLLRLQDGRIGCVYLVKWTERHLTPMWTYSEDEGETWSTPTPFSDETEYFCVVSDRLVQLADGTLALPYARLNPGQVNDTPEFDYRWNMLCGLFFSPDRGATWKRSGHEVTHTAEVFTPPLIRSELQNRADMVYQVENRLGVFQEPGLQQLSDGSLMLYMRSSYAIYRSVAKNAAAPWEDISILPGLNVCCSPQAIRRLPTSGNLLMLYNDRGQIAWGEKEFHQRTPLSAAISRDEGKTWQRWGQLEDDSRNYCYYSILFYRSQFVLSYYESAPPALPGKFRRNLASLKVCTGPTDIFDTLRS